jgi:hypothetical protein
VLLFLSVPSSVATALVPALLCFIASIAVLLLAAMILCCRPRQAPLPGKHTTAAAVYIL